MTFKTEARELYRLLNTGRKYIIPLLENLEELKITPREGDYGKSRASD